MDPSPAEKKELFLADLAGRLPGPWPPGSPGPRLPGAGRAPGLQREGRFLELGGKSAERSPRRSLPLLSRGLAEKDFLVFYYLYYIMFRAGLDPTCGQKLCREQRTGVETA